jgi:hypothetical protein
MSQRVIIGKKGSDYGMWISAPGKEATSSVYEDLLIDTNRINTQPLIKGFLSDVTLDYDAGLSSPALPNCSAFQNIGIVPLAHNGTAYYKYTIAHGLGFVPLCHLSIRGLTAGSPRPRFFIDTTNLILVYEENHGAYAEYAGGVSPNITWNNFGDCKPSSYTFSELTIHYTLFRQRLITP